MRESSSASRAGRRVAAGLLVLAALAGCAGQQLAVLQSDLESLQRQSVEQRNTRRLMDNSNFVVTPESTPVDLAPKYLAIAESARRSAEGGSVKPIDRLAFQQVRGRAAWKAAAEAVGRSSEALATARGEVAAASDQGVALCQSLGAAALPVSCAVLALLPTLVELELAAGTWVNEQDPTRRRPLLDQAEVEAPFLPAVDGFNSVAMTDAMVTRALQSRGFAPWLCAIYRGIATNAGARKFAVDAVARPDGISADAAAAAAMKATENWRIFSQMRSPTGCQPPPP